ncbi:aminotransferase [Celeribacter neptunius]|uniref:4-aminobutyrate---pyruvate transaminase n=1 Tax=Celeribacter neptunius TaxID=588602 RepID=A0A1I3TAC1_9RHOB|nr:aminotransferase [Celeribacter neptunius]SFJ67885.1 4-aminobutyrate---pyruvate transaminase [Celeribacter neptunius]
MTTASDSILHPFTNLSQTAPAPIRTFAKGDGLYVIGDDGERYFEAMSGLWSVSLGFSEKRLADAATRQLQSLPFYHIFMSSSHEQVRELAEALIARAPGQLAHVGFSTSGSEANETAVKAVWQYNNVLGRPQKKKIIARWDAYHGSTALAASLCGLPNMHSGFDLPLGPILHTGSPHHWRHAKPGETEEAFATRLADELEQMIQREGPDTIAAFIAEPIMGAGGVIVPPASYFDKIVPVLKKHDILLIADEIICGFGRTGTYWGSELCGIEPDILVCGKQLSGGYLPISATLMTDEIYSVIATETSRSGGFSHGFTHSGNPVCAAVANEAIRIYDERDIVAGVARKAEVFHAALREAFTGAEHVGEVRGVGLLGAVELAPEGDPRRSFADKAGALWARDIYETEKTVVRAVHDAVVLCPPLIVEEGDLIALVERLRRSYDRVLPQIRALSTTDY